MHAKKASRDKLPTCNDAHKWCTTVCKQDDFGLRLQFLPVELRRKKSSVRWSNEKSQAGYSIPHLVDQILFFFGSYPNFGSNHGLIRLNVHLLQKECELLPEWVHHDFLVPPGSHPMWYTHYRNPSSKGLISGHIFKNSYGLSKNCKW